MRANIWLVVGMASVGGLLGYLTGASATSIVATIAAAVVALLGSAFSLVTNLNSSDVLEKRGRIPFLKIHSRQIT